jgi:hypothetical protein
MTVFEKLDKIRQRVDKHRLEPLFSEELATLSCRYQTTVATEENNLLRVMAKLIAYSNNAPSDKVTQMLERTNHFENAFHGFDLSAVANATPEKILDEHWHNLKAIRFRKKVGAITKCACILKAAGNPTIESLYQQNRLPVELTSARDIDTFWQQFEAMLDRFGKQGMPHFRQDTTLLHLLLHIGFPCVKPDLIVMRTAAMLGIVPDRENHNQYRPHEKKLAVKTIQEYCLARGIKPAVMDLYLLIYGGQRDSVRYVDQGFTPAVM